jgi:hypothetical protein
VIIRETAKSPYKIVAKFVQNREDLLACLGVIGGKLLLLLVVSLEKGIYRELLVIRFCLIRSSIIEYFLSASAVSSGTSVVPGMTLFLRS